MISKERVVTFAAGLAHAAKDILNQKEKEAFEA